MVARSWHREGLEEILSARPERQPRPLPSRILCLPLMSILKIASASTNCVVAESCWLQLATNRDDWIIRVRICRMWDAINPKNNGELISLDMVFIDEKGKNLLEDVTEPKDSGPKGCPTKKNVKRLTYKNKQVSAVVLLDSLEDPEDELHAIDGAKSRKRRNLIVHDDESSDEDTNKCKK
ncbi:hypothetical protein K7X08_022338 [Anisodus acutangulus]|uniref:Uncharacterized protein n=1 Tax=Anisodus acutangulus TaxID=402998 RepID=A0A9Q1MKY0_9SOLA|nr:hypothetical protein K7X08_022338 [Anisodus acutangulus]